MKEKEKKKRSPLVVASFLSMAIATHGQRQWRPKEARKRQEKNNNNNNNNSSSKNNNNNNKEESQRERKKENKENLIGHYDPLTDRPARLVLLVTHPDFLSVGRHFALFVFSVNEHTHTHIKKLIKWKGETKKFLFTSVVCSWCSRLLGGASADDVLFFFVEKTTFWGH